MPSTLIQRIPFVRRVVFAAVIALLVVSSLTSIRHARGAPMDSMDSAHPRTSIVIRAGGKIITATLNDSRTAQDFIKTLPRSMKMTRWGDREFYGKVGTRLFDAGARQKGFADGDISYWATGGSFAIFYDSSKDQNISDLIVIGKISSDVGVFKSLEDQLDMQIELAP